MRCRMSRGARPARAATAAAPGPLAVTAALALALTLWAPATAHAYPQYTLSRQTTCSACHVSPAGGGLLDGMGPITAEDEATFGGDGGFLEGKVTLPEWLKVGGDFRVAGGGSDNGGGFSGAFFPMQLEAYAAVTRGDFTGYATVGMAPVNENDALEILQTREHWAMWKPQAEELAGLYVRAGRFLPVHGLRLAEHPLYVRRYGGTPLYGETYGVSAGWIDDSVEVHLTAFTKDPLRTPQERGNGAALYTEKRVGERFAIGAQARFADSTDDRRTQGGLTAKLWVEPANLLFQAEGSYIRQKIDAGPGRNQLVGQLLATWFFKPGFFLDVGVGQYDADMSLADQDRTAIDVNLHWFPWAHGELLLTNRFQTIGLGEGGDSSGFTLLQFHYRL
jgi:hypothetical protein